MSSCIFFIIFFTERGPSLSFLPILYETINWKEEIIFIDYFLRNNQEKKKIRWIPPINFLYFTFYEQIETLRICLFVWKYSRNSRSKTTFTTSCVYLAKIWIPYDNSTSPFFSLSFFVGITLWTHIIFYLTLIVTFQI